MVFDMSGQKPRGESYLVALAVVARNSLLLVIRGSKGQLELPGQSTMRGGDEAEKVEKLVAELGLEQQPSQTLYLQVPLSQRKQGRPVVSVIRVIRLNKPLHLPLTGGKFEPVSRLAGDPEVSPVVQAVAQWLLGEQASPQRGRTKLTG